MHLLLWADDAEAELRSELEDFFPGAPVRSLSGLAWGAEFEIPQGPALPQLAFLRQILPYARHVYAASIRAWADELTKTLIPALLDSRPWQLHIEPHFAVSQAHRIGARAWHTAHRHLKAPTPDQRDRLDDRGPKDRQPAAGPGIARTEQPESRRIDAKAGRRRCELIRGAVLEILGQKRRSLLRQLRSSPTSFTPQDSLVQVLLTAPDAGYLSIAPAPLPFEQKHLLSFFPKGEIPVASDKSAPSRAFAKLVEAELRLGRSIAAGESCIDLGAAPGSWTYVAQGRGARIIAVDRSPLREDLMRNPQVKFEPGDAFDFEPPQVVDWLLCDVIAPAERTAQLLLKWLARGWCRHFVVTLKLRDTPIHGALIELKRELPALGREFFLKRLCASKREVCAFG